MAVQKSKVSRSRRGMRRSHHALAAPTLTQDSVTGETRRRHHIGSDGKYRGKMVAPPRIKKSGDDAEEGES